MQQRTIGSGPTSTDVSVLCLGTMHFGTHTPRETAFQVLDRFVDAGGTFLDTANNYNAWDEGGQGHESEDVIGAWLASRGLRDRVRIATKCGAAKKDPALPLSNTHPTNFQGLGAETIAREAATSLRHLGVDRLDVLYGHVDDRDTALEETVGAFGKLVADGVVGVPGISNVTTWRVVEARETAARLGVEPYGVVQQQGGYVYPSPTPFRSSWVSGDLLDYAASTGGDGLDRRTPGCRAVRRRPAAGRLRVPEPDAVPVQLGVRRPARLRRVHGWRRSRSPHAWVSSRTASSSSRAATCTRARRRSGPAGCPATCSTTPRPRVATV